MPHPPMAQQRAHSQARVGFTLIEILIVVMIISILATIAVTKFGDSKRRAHITTMKSDLRNLALQAESKFASDETYAGLAASDASVDVTLNVQSSLTEWSATATHAKVPGVECTITSAPRSPSDPQQPDCQ